MGNTRLAAKGARRALQPATISAGQRALRLLWNIVWNVFYRPSPTPFHAWRRMLLRAFGATVGRRAHPYPRARIWAPWNLEMGDDSCLADDVDCYCVARVTLGHHSTVSQYSYLCSASHDYNQPSMPTVAAPIRVEDEAWIAADVFVGPGVTVARGAVVGARSTIMSDVAAWHVVVGSPPRHVQTREAFVRP